ncbi:MAG TPA: TolC family protein [Bacteroidales bacterium]|nr:TolC family protein [Bacteroidales bacterium]
MKKVLLTALFLVSLSAAQAQKIVTLWQCYDSAAAVTPLAREAALYSEISSLRDQNLAASYLPNPDLNGSFIYNSDIPDLSGLLGSLPIPPGSVPSIPHEQYRATIDVSQTIWDGGVTRSARAVEQVVRDLNMKQNEADIYRLREQINNYYFSILLTSLQMEVTEIMISDIEARLKEAESGIRNGIIPEVTLDILFAEKVKVTQALTETSHRHDALLSALGMITGMGDLSHAQLMVPEQSAMTDSIIYNPDLQLFDLHRKQLEVSKDLLKSQRMPRAFGFAQMGYGNPPGSNFFSETADTYYSMGIGVKWNIFDWKKNSNERKSLTLQQQLIDIRKRAVEEALERVLTVRKAEIASLREVAASDEILVAVRKKIIAVSASQLLNGTITAAQYLTDLNSEKQASINAGLRRINIARAEAEYINITGRK